MRIAIALGVASLALACSQHVRAQYEFSVASLFQQPVELVKKPSHKIRGRAAPIGGDDAKQKQALADFERDFSAVLKRRQVPGMMYTVVRQNKTIAASGLGATDMTKPDSKVDGDTLFMIGSVTKSMTAALFGTVADEGKVKFTDKISDTLPRFRLKDPIASLQCTFEDAMSHRTGLPRHDALLQLTKNDTVNDFLDRLRYLEPHTEFRSTWEYNNMMWAVTGHAAAAALGNGVTYEDALQKRIFDKTDMKTALPGPRFLPGSGRKASTGHILVPTPDGKNYTLIALPAYNDIGVGAPAGNVLASANDAAAYLRMMLAKGLAQDGKTRVLSNTTVSEIFRSRMVFGNDGGDMPQPIFSKEQTYAQGWFQLVYRGKHRIIQHGGAIDGFITLFALFPDDDLAIAASINQFTDFSSYAAVLDLADRFLGYDDVDWGALYGNFVDASLKKGLQKPERIPGTQPSRPIDAYLGNYMHKGYGTMRVTKRDGVVDSKDGLLLSFGSLVLPLKHAQYDTYTLALGIETSFDVTFFSTNGAKSMSYINMASLEPALKELIFTKTI
ncbi:beta-lactamase/transpeptidase-like protein [Ramicandelaber brevisporus]|nr:beta-lactamase/transpeptidase-like protein [Ramicandelaber brevisporus]